MAKTKKLQGIGTLWHGTELGILERACLVSMMEQGHDVTLFSHNPVHNVPEGVQVCNAKDICGNLLDEFSVPVQHIRHEHIRRGHARRIPMMFSDIFRYTMIQETDLIWADLDAFLLKPLMPDDGYLFAYVTENIINGGVLGLPKNSPALMDLIDFCRNHYPIPPFFKAEKKILLLAKKIIGRSTHMSLQDGNVAGPGALTYFLQKNNESQRSLPTVALYPIFYTDTHLFFYPYDYVHEEYLRESISIHVWGSWFNTKIKIADKIPVGSLLHELLKRGE